MKTLIIHPEDSSTVFLENIYTTIPQKTIITGGVTKLELKDLIQSHSRVIMLGHGSPEGLLSVGKFYETNGYIIDHTMVDVLRTKKNNIYIWCHADQFVNFNRLSGFFSGMFISELEEADYFGICEATREMIDESNLAFGNLLSVYVNYRKQFIHDNIIREYGALAFRNSIARYNCLRLYVK